MNEPEETLENRIVDISVIDPVCGMAVNPVEARGKAHHEATDLLFLLARLHAQVCVVAGEVSLGRQGAPQPPLRHRLAQPRSSTKIRFAEWMSMPRRPLRRWSTRESCITSAAAAARRNSRTIRRSIFRPITRPAAWARRFKPVAPECRSAPPASWRKTWFAG